MHSDDQPSPAALPAVHPALSGALSAQGYDTLTAVQLAMLEQDPAADLLVSAQTGSGKTVAFGLAIAPTLLGEGRHFEAPERPLGLVIAPTRELALQVQRELDWLYAGAGVVTASCVGGMDQRTERRALERGAHIVVGTPGRLRDHITRNALDLSAVRAIVLDEADEMLDLGFREDLEFILAAAPPERRTLLFSATVPRAIAELAQTFQRDAVRVTATAASEPHADIDYRVTLVEADEREHAIINTLLLNDTSSALVFCHTREAVRHLTARLANRGFDVVALSGELAQSERSSALQAMRDGRARVCVATDVAARGIDLPNLDLVIHADLPSNPATLLHRSGRTGRAGRKGVCVLIVPLHRRKAAERVLGFAHLEASFQPAPGIAEIEARYRRQILETAEATLPPDADEKPFIEELLERLTPEQMAAAYLRQQLAARPVPEEISPMRVHQSPERAPRKKRFEDVPVEREPRAPHMMGGVWFTLSLGRKHRADPKWLLPMICKAGGVTKRDVGSIKILDHETRFEISADRAVEFAERATAGTLEKGVRIAAAGAPEQARPHSRPRHQMAERERPKRYNPAAAEKVVTEDPRPAADEVPPRKEKRKPEPKSKAKFKPKYQGNPKDKGKPKYKGKADRAGDAPRQRGPKP
ncbi:MAG: DEAD/DEAH box helicase [Devosia sp.]|uniref:DEAD/DEAH box helicase n=1 Tax=Devosia sp. 66-22 TaxID=1895753 RepID=UPI000928D317|nr:DEAD/DEAH box helicase [Devosia sp. 66-22]MBN9348119.1 DEAD/DEAH box helicase [Devosia sp.]OJX55252.1 MAG: helicase [Devosia sp. 66-22]